MPAVLCLLLAATGCTSAPVSKTVPEALDIVEINRSERTQTTKVTLLELAEKYDLKPYLFTSHVQIQAYVRPHSHPILTLNTRDGKNPDLLLGQFLHEQLHWFVDSQAEGQAKAIADFKKMDPALPTDPTQLAGSADATYMHLIVGYLELQGLKHYLGKDKAYRQIKAIDLYPWVYQTLLKDESKVASVLDRYGIAIALSSFPTLEAHEIYGKDVSEDEACKAATARFNETKCFLSYERNFLKPIFK